jgi:hypothetical protein
LLSHGNGSFFERFTYQAAFQYATVGAVFAFVTRIAHPILAVANQIGRGALGTSVRFDLTDHWRIEFVTLLR